MQSIAIAFPVICYAAAMELWIIHSPGNSCISIHNLKFICGNSLPLPSKTENAQNSCVKARQAATVLCAYRIPRDKEAGQKARTRHSLARQIVEGISPCVSPEAVAMAVLSFDYYKQCSHACMLIMAMPWEVSEGTSLSVTLLLRSGNSQ